jgi:hypothetical protein
MKKLVLSFDKDKRLKTILSHDLESIRVFSLRSLIHSNSFQKKTNHTCGSFLLSVAESEDHPPSLHTDPIHESYARSKPFEYLVDLVKNKT